MGVDPFAAAFGPGRVPGFDGLPAELQVREARRTRNAVAELLSRPRAEFPSIPVRYGGREVPQHIVDAAYTSARMTHRAMGRPQHYDWIAAMAAELPPAIAADQQRKAMRLPLPIYSFDGARRAGEAARRDVPRELVAPLIFDVSEALADD